MSNLLLLKHKMKKILIFGGSGFLGKAIYKELNPFFNLHCTYYKNIIFKKNKRFHYFDIRYKSIKLLNKIQPNIIISSISGDFYNQISFHNELINYCDLKKIKLMFISSSNVFDYFTNFPSYEDDKTFSNSIYGKFKINIENKILRLKNKNWAILRSPMIFDNNSPRIVELKKNIFNQHPIEIFPNLIVNINSAKFFAKQIHYIISRNLTGIIHHGSKDLLLHTDLISSILKKLNFEKINYKYVYTTNDNRYLALFSKKKTFPKHLQFGYDIVLNDLGKTV